jgi:hypothetical protein
MTNRGRQSFPFGIEKEYFLVSSRTRALVDEPPIELLDECKNVLGNRVSETLPNRGRNQRLRELVRCSR